MPRIVNGDVESRLSAGRQTLIELDEDMLATRATRSLDDGGFTVAFDVDTDPERLERELRSGPLGRVLLGEGHSLIWPYDDDTERSSDIIVGDVPVSAVEVTASGRSWTSTPPFKVSSERSKRRRERTHYVSRWVGVGLWYGEKTKEQKGDAVQYVGGGFTFDTYTGTADAIISRMVLATRRLRGEGKEGRYYHGHHGRQRSVSDKKLLRVAQTVRRQFELREVDEVEADEDDA